MSETRENKGTGLWTKKGVPHKGWECLETYDLFEESGPKELSTCEMCEVQQIRFVHVMTHPDFSEILKCGCVCAGYMSEEKVANEKDQAMRLRAARRTNFPTLKSWRISEKGNYYIKKNGYHIAVAVLGEKYRLIIKTPKDENIHGNIRYNTIEAAQIAAFDTLERLDNEFLKSLKD